MPHRQHVLREYLRNFRERLADASYVDAFASSPTNFDILVRNAVECLPINPLTDDAPDGRGLLVIMIDDVDKAAMALVGDVTMTEARAHLQKILDTTEDDDGQQEEPTPGRQQ